MSGPRMTHKATGLAWTLLNGGDKARPFGVVFHESASLPRFYRRFATVAERQAYITHRVTQRAANMAADLTAKRLLMRCNFDEHDTEYRRGRRTRLPWHIRETYTNLARRGTL